MVKYVFKRIGLAFVTAFIILSLTFILMKLLPFSMPVGTEPQCYSYFQGQVNQGFVKEFQLGIKDYDMLSNDSENNTYRAAFEAQNGDILWMSKTVVAGKTVVMTETPVMTQYFSWLRNIITKWDWGTSTYIKVNVGAIHIIGERLPTTIKINVLSVIFSVPLGILLGIWAALKKNTTTDHIISTSIMVFISIPSFVLITFLMLIFCYSLGWLPTQWPGDSASQTDKILGYILPLFCLSFGSICGYCRFTRAELCEVMSSEYLLLARTKGLTKKQAILRHALRNAMVPIVPSILAEFIGILGGSMILERLYGIRGIGALFVDALNSKDYNVLFVDMAIFTTISLLAGVILDISYGFIDPRIRMGAKK